MKIKLATRKTPLALAQTLLAENLLQSAGFDCERVVMTTDPDSKLNTPLSQFEKSAFTSALEQAVLEGKADCAVHSLKDLGVRQPDPLACVAFLPRAAVADVWVSQKYRSPDKAPEGAKVGSSSIRRFWQLKQRWPHLDVIPIRGSVGTRLQHLERDYDAVILAQAGLDRLALDPGHSMILTPEHHVPSPGQGAIVLQMSQQHPWWTKLRELSHQKTEQEVTLERQLVAFLGGHCQVPLGVLAYHHQGKWWMKAGLYAKNVCIEADFSHQDSDTVYQKIMRSLVKQGIEDAIQAMVNND
ncbi:MAG TPA: hydroxymethylbilane synthase [Gammaproteobacteria bacterium]|nr:hydroxymethylbilane synthase [Gammaproteobacteria bacterium]